MLELFSDKCSYERDRARLVTVIGYDEAFPETIVITSARTGVRCMFVSEPACSNEYSVYIPVHPVPNLNSLVVYREPFPEC